MRASAAPALRREIETNTAASRVAPMSKHTPKGVRSARRVQSGRASTRLRSTQYPVRDGAGRTRTAKWIGMPSMVMLPAATPGPAVRASARVG